MTSIEPSRVLVLIDRRQWFLNEIGDSDFGFPQWDPAADVTFSGRTSCHHVPDHPHHRQRHDAGDAEDHTHQAVVEAGDVAADPGVVERRGDGERVHAERHADVRHGQVHRQQLGRFEPGQAASGADQDGGVPVNGQDGCRGKSEGAKKWI